MIHSITLSVLLVLLSFGTEITAREIPSDIARIIPSQYSIYDRNYRDAKNEILELLDQCGAGVFIGVDGERVRGAKNRCQFEVKLDDLFFEPKFSKTGLLHKKDWAYLDGVTWFEPKPQRAVPDSFDLRDLMKNGQPVIKKQQCGDCWAWSTHHGLEIARAVHDQKVYDHSIQTVLSCSRKGSCSGGYMTAVDFLLKGLPLEEDFPYAASDKACKYSSSQLQTGWEPKALATPYIGSSKTYSLAKRNDDGTFREGTKVQKMMEAMYQWNAPLVVTVAAYSLSGDGVYSNCSAINSGGDHMVAIVGWEMWQGKRVAHVWNSWGPSHGKDGVSKIVWECGNGQLNRGLGVSAKVVQYKAPCTPPDAAQTYLKEIKSGGSVEIGAQQSPGTKCTWAPTTGLANPNSCVTTASPSQSTEYHLTAENNCGTSSSMTLVHVWPGRQRAGKEIVKTIYGNVELYN